MNSRLKTIALFAALLGFFVLTLPSNHSEAEDAYYYSRMAEQGSWSEMFHGHHLLYLPLMRMIFRGCQLCGYAGRSMPVLIGVSMISGALAVYLFAALLRRADVKKRTSWTFSAALLFSYGFWRYSTTAEIYIPATALALLTLYCAARAKDRPLFFAGSILSGACALLMHLITLPAVLLAVPLLYFKKCRRRAVLYSILTGLLASAVYFSVYRTAGLTVFADTQVVRETLLSPRVWLKAAAASGQDLLSANFLFVFPSAASKLEVWFPFQMLQEELFMGQQASVWARWQAPVTLGVAAALLTVLLFFAARNIRRAVGAYPALTVAVFLWLGGTAAMAFYVEPANPEMWICALPPFWLLIGLIWSTMPSGRLVCWLPAALTAALLAHNWTGGMGLVKNPDGDYCRQKSAWIAGQARPGDTILTADSHSFVTFLEYATSARVLDAKFSGEEHLATARTQAGGRIFVFSDVIKPLPPVAKRLPVAVQQMQRLGAALEPDLQIVHQDLFGTVYRWTVSSEDPGQ